MATFTPRTASSESLAEKLPFVPRMRRSGSQSDLVRCQAGVHVSSLPDTTPVLRSSVSRCTAPGERWKRITRTIFEIHDTSRRDSHGCTCFFGAALTLIFEQMLNGVQLGVMLFLLAAGLTLIFGIMGVLNLAHGSLYMIGAYGAAWAAAKTGSFWLAIPAGLAAAAIAGILIELIVIRRLYARDHLDQVLATFGLILFFNQAVTLIFGRQPVFVGLPSLFNGSVSILGLPYPLYRLVIIGVGLAVAIGLYLLISRTRLGMLIRAGATHRDIVRALGVDIGLLYTLIFGLGALLAGLAGTMAGPLASVQVGMGEQILILTFVVVVIGGIGSVRGAFFGALLVGITDTAVRGLAPIALRAIMPPSQADALGAGLSSISVYLLMALVLLIRPKGLFAPQGQSA